MTRGGARRSGSAAARLPRSRAWLRSGGVPVALAALALLCALAAPALGEDLAQSEIERRAAAETAAEARAKRAAAEAAEHRAARLAAESRRIGEERAALGQSIVAREDALNRAARHLDALRREIAATRARLGASRAELQTLIAQMQRAAREPTPALLAHPSRPVDAARSAILLRSLSSRMSAARAAMADDLGRLDVSAERVAMVERSAAEELAALRREEARAARLLAAKRRAEEAERESAAAARRQAEELAKQALSLTALAEALQDRELREQRERALEAPKPKTRPERPEVAPEAGELAALAPRETERENRPVREVERKDERPRRAIPTPSAPRASGAGDARLVKPASGEMTPAGGSERRGVYVFTRPYARVISPAAGLVRYAGDITSEGKVVIIEPKSGVLILLAGMGSLEASPGSHVAAGEPIGRMGGPASASEEFMFELTPETASSRERLYVEVHQKGRQIDPRPWFGSETKEVAAND